MHKLSRCVNKLPMVLLIELILVLTDCCFDFLALFDGLLKSHSPDLYLFCRNKSGFCYECWIFAVCNGSKNSICDTYMLKDACLKEILWNCNRAEIGVSLFMVQVSYWKWNSEKIWRKKYILPLFHCSLALIMLLRAWTPLYTQELLLHSIVRINEK